MNKFELDSNPGKLGLSSTSQIFFEFEFGSSSLENLMNRPEHSKVRLDSAHLQSYLNTYEQQQLFGGLETPSPYA